ncbi:hypothetical protein OJAV_G00086000 [Oryzias javanicus]|uniref:Ciliary neurotrophic factor n=1 Tax=Oryzias javanicus TaxID=123683 RepID=A0A3S2MVN9_ORYJA|nr:hypothetical protein OJAV_G00086000 [Oryzias javanicus]
MFLVFTLILVGLQWSFGVPAPVRTDFHRMMSIAGILQHEVEGLLNKSMDNSIIFRNMPKYPEKTPSSSITGKSFPQNLEDMVLKGHLFYFHVAEMSRHLKNLTRRPAVVSTIFTTVKATLQRLLQTVKKNFESVHPEMGPLTTPAPPEFPERSFFEQKSHGTVVLLRLGEWVKNVQRVLRQHHVAPAHGSQ